MEDYLVVRRRSGFTLVVRRRSGWRTTSCLMEVRNNVCIQYVSTSLSPVIVLVRSCISDLVILSYMIRTSTSKKHCGRRRLILGNGRFSDH